MRMDPKSEFELLLAPREQAWVDLRARLTRVAREVHFFAFSSDAVNSSIFLAISEHFADLAMSIPIEPIAAEERGPVHASTLFAAQVLQWSDGVAAGKRK